MLDDDLVGSGLSTVVARDAKGQNTYGDNLRKWNNRSAQSNSDRNMITALKEIDRMAEHMSLPGQIAYTSKVRSLVGATGLTKWLALQEYYAKVEKHKALRGRTSESIIAACVYIGEHQSKTTTLRAVQSGCRMEGHPRTLKGCDCELAEPRAMSLLCAEIAGQTSATKKDIGSSMKYITKVLDIKAEMAQNNIKATDYMVPHALRESSDHVSDQTRFCSHLDLPESVTAAARFIAEKSTEMRLVAG